MSGKIISIGNDQSLIETMKLLITTQLISKGIQLDGNLNYIKQLDEFDPGEIIDHLTKIYLTEFNKLSPNSLINLTGKGRVEYINNERFVLFNQELNVMTDQFKCYPESRDIQREFMDHFKKPGNYQVIEWLLGNTYNLVKLILEDSDFNALSLFDRKDYHESDIGVTIAVINELRFMDTIHQYRKELKGLSNNMDQIAVDDLINVSVCFHVTDKTISTIVNKLKGFTTTIYHKPVSPTDMERESVIIATGNIMEWRRFIWRYSEKEPMINVIKSLKKIFSIYNI